MPGKTLSRRFVLGGVLAAAVCPAAAALARDFSTFPTMDRSGVRVRFGFDGRSMTAMLYSNATARDFASMLPLALTIKDFGRNEKIVHLPRKLTEEGAGPFANEQAGDLCYFRPWGNLALFYDGYRQDGLIRIGRFEEGFDPLFVRGKFPVHIDRA